MALTTHPYLEVKERVELYLYSPSRPSQPVLGCTLPLIFSFVLRFDFPWINNNVCCSVDAVQLLRLDSSFGLVRGGNKEVSLYLRNNLANITEGFPSPQAHSVLLRTPLAYSKFVDPLLVVFKLRGFYIFE